jgi:HEPN domain-containing protein
MADSAIRKSETISSKAGKHLRGLAGYHLQQAAEKMIKYQIYDSGITIDYGKMFRHSLDDLMA